MNPTLITHIRTLGIALALAVGASAHASGGKAPKPSEPAPPDLRLLAAGGTACPGLDSIRVVGTGSKIGAEFKDFVAETAGQSTIARAACSLALPVEIPAGWQLVIDRATVRGVARLHAGHRATVRLDLFTAGTRGPSLTREIDANGPFELTVTASDVSEGDTIATACGPTTVNLRANLSAIVRGAGSKAQVTSLGDDAAEGLFGFHWRKCN